MQTYPGDIDIIDIILEGNISFHLSHGNLIFFSVNLEVVRLRPFPAQISNST